MHFLRVVLITTIGLLVNCCSAEDPAITFISSETIRNVGETADLTCVVENRKEYSLIWQNKYRDHPNDDINVIAIGETFVVKEKRMVVAFNETSGTYTLTIKDIQVSDAGTYECQIVVSGSQKITKQVDLLIRHQAIISDNLMNSPIIVAEKEIAELTCTAKGYPRPTILWKRAEDMILPNGGLSFVGNTLKIDSALRQDRGTYYCYADNGVGSADKKNINLEVEFAPSISIRRPKVAQAVDYDIELECQVEAYPAPTIEWEKNGSKLFNEDEYHILTTANANENTRSTLRITSVQRKHYGDYLCKVGNKKGNTEARVNLFEISVPDINFPGLQWRSAGSESILKDNTMIVTLVTSILIIFH